VPAPEIQKYTPARDSNISSIYIPSGGFMEKTVRTVPAILTNDPALLRIMVAKTERFANYVQFDLMDGQFVPSTSITCNDIVTLKASLQWEAHLMVMNPENLVDELHKAGAQKIIFHFEATKTPKDVVNAIHDHGMKAGLAVNPDTTIEEIKPLVKFVDSVLFMAVHPGFYGAEFIPAVLNKTADFRKQFPEMEIGMDGGINEKTIPAIVKTGVDVIYIGSAIYRKPNPALAYRRLAKLASKCAAER